MYTYSLRFLLGPKLNFDERMNSLIDFCKKAKMDEVMFFIAPKELGVGHITKEESKDYVETIKKARDMLKREGIKTTLNPWVTLGHYDVGVGLKEGQNFRLMVGHDGKTGESCPCPLCENWLSYYADLMSYYVEEIQPDVLWIEDDMRLGNHTNVSLGCFCDEHMKLYNAKLGSNYDRETFVSLIGKDKKVRKAFLDVARETMEKCVEYIVKNTKGQKKWGLMTADASLHHGRKLGRLFEIMSSHGEKPINRCCLYSYRQKIEQEYAWCYNKWAKEVQFYTGDKAENYMEIENVPHSLYTKSVNFFRYQMLTSASMQFTGATFSMFEFNGNGANNYERYAKMLAEIKPYLAKIAELGLTENDAVGVKVLVNEETCYHKKAESVFDLAHDDSWIYAYLEQLGIACTRTTDTHMQNQTVAISGQVLRNFDDETIVNLFKNNFVITTAENIVYLKERGLEYLLDIKDIEYWEQQVSGKYTFEEINGEDRIFGVSQMRAPAQQTCGNHLHITYGEKEKTVYTVMKDNYENLAGAGITRTQKALVIPYKDNDTQYGLYWPVAMLCPLREHVIKKCLERESPLGKDLVYVAEENVSPYVYDKGDTRYIFLANFIDDSYPELHIKMKEKYKDIKVIKVGAEEGVAVDYEYKEGEYVIKEPLLLQQSYILICQK